MAAAATAKTATRFEIRAVRWLPGEVPAGQPHPCERIAADYDRVTATDALAAFAAGRPEAAAYGSRWDLTCVIPATTPPPERRFLMNWERHPDAEVSGGWLSNIAAAGNNLMDRLEWEPEFCATPAAGSRATAASPYGTASSAGSIPARRAGSRPAWAPGRRRRSRRLPPSAGGAGPGWKSSTTTTASPIRAARRVTRTTRARPSATCTTAGDPGEPLRKPASAARTAAALQGICSTR
jgi:hypothetical protein